MSAILFLMGTSRGDALNGVMRGLSGIFADHGYEPIPFDLTRGDILQELERVAGNKQVLFALGFAGIGRDIMLSHSDGRRELMWEALGIPYISANGDSPAYFFDRHVNPSNNFATFYSFREHYMFRKTLPHLQGLYGLAPPTLFDKEPVEKIDFKAKESGKIIFLKNGGDTEALRETWKIHCTPHIYKMLCDIADVLVANVGTEAHPNLDNLVTEYFKLKGMDVDAMTNLRLFFTAQLDDYFRRAKCRLVAGVLKDFPVEIHGDNWGFMDFTGARCKLVSVCDYQTSRTLIRESLGIVDFSPNTQGGFHDRPMRTFGMHSLCISNEQECFTELFGADNGITYRFDKDSIAQRVNDVLTHPKEYVEVGRETSRIFAETFPGGDVVRTFVEAAEVMRLGNTKERSPIADYFVWPPQARD